MKKIKIVGLTLLIIIFMTSCKIAVNWSYKHDMYQAGDFSITAADSSVAVAVKSESNIFDISDVTFDLYYGLYNIDQYEENVKENTIVGYRYERTDKVFFAMYLCNSDDDNELYVCAEFDDYQSIDGYEYVKNISLEEAMKQEYAYETSKVGRITYNYSEQFTIPEHFFVDQKGSIRIIIFGFVEPSQKTPYYTSSWGGDVELDYELTKDGKVKIKNLRRD